MMRAAGFYLTPWFDSRICLQIGTKANDFHPGNALAGHIFVGGTDLQSPGIWLAR
jgi:hypothetical protein